MKDLLQNYIVGSVRRAGLKLELGGGHLGPGVLITVLDSSHIFLGRGLSAQVAKDKTTVLGLSEDSGMFQGLPMKVPNMLYRRGYGYSNFTGCMSIKDRENIWYGSPPGESLPT